MIREERGATPNIVLPPGSYVVHVTLGLVSAVRPVTLKAETDRESFLLPAGGLRIEGRVGTSKIPQNQISFSIYKGSQFEIGERAPLVPSVAAGDCRAAAGRDLLHHFQLRRRQFGGALGYPRSGRQAD